MGAARGPASLPSRTVGLWLRLLTPQQEGGELCHSPWSQREHSKTLIHAWACLIPYPVGKLPGGPSKSWGDFSSLPLAVRPAVWPGRLWPWTAGRGMACRPGRRHPPPPPHPTFPPCSRSPAGQAGIATGSGHHLPSPSCHRPLHAHLQGRHTRPLGR